jgi:four helix bundle protein
VEPNFVSLDVYALAELLADELRRAVRGWDSFDRWTIGVQTVRASQSIGANIAEASGRWSMRDRTHFLVTARGSAFELQHWIRRAQAAELALPEQSMSRAGRVAQMLNRLIESARARS